MCRGWLDASLWVWGQWPQGHGRGSSAAPHSAECCASTRIHLVCLELPTPLLSTSAPAFVEACARSSSFLPPKHFSAVLTAGKFQGDGDNSAGCETNPPKPKATTVKTIDKRDRRERRKGKHISEKLCCFWLWPVVCIESSLLSVRAADTCQLSEPCLCSSALCRGKAVVTELSLQLGQPFPGPSALPCSCWLLTSTFHLRCLSSPHRCRAEPSTVADEFLLLFQRWVGVLLSHLAAWASCAKACLSRRTPISTPACLAPNGNWVSAPRSCCCSILLGFLCRAAGNKCGCEIRVHLGNVGMSFSIVKWCSSCWEVQPGCAWLCYCSAGSWL